jgi:iron complex transport system substrate-binding protein
MDMKRCSIRLWILLMVLALSICFSTSSLGAKDGAVRTFRDDTGYVLRMVRPPRRIVSLAPNMTEILYAIGVGDRVVGVTEFCNYPKGVKGKARVGGAQIQAEAVLALKPDLVVAQVDMQPAVIKQLRALGVSVAAYQPYNWRTVLYTIRQLGLMTGRKATATNVIRKMESRRMKIQASTAGRHRPRVFIEIWNKPLMTAGPGTFLHELILMAGGDDIASELKRPWAVISAETVLKKDPEIILLTCKNKRELLRRSGWGSVTAVRQGHVYEVDPDIFCRPGPRLANGLETLADLFTHATAGEGGSKEGTL